jgi:ATP-dependent helicase HepA
MPQSGVRCARSRRDPAACAIPPAVFKPGSKLQHPFNPELGVGVVRAIEGRFLSVYFPATGEELTLSAEAGLERLIVAPGEPIRLIEDERVARVAAVDGHYYVLDDGSRVHEAETWPMVTADTPVERLAKLQLDSLAGFRNRLDGLELMALREAGGLGSFLGGRIELFPHQLYAARRAVERDAVRWLFADEVGLGKTVEACLVLSALLRTGRAQRALVLAPPTLTVQWLGELYRKFHQVFVLLDRERIEAVASNYGEGVNPFEVHPFAVMSVDALASDAELRRAASEAELDVVVLDEAHRLARSEQASTVAPLVRQAKHALLLTATPLQADLAGFHRLLDLLHPELFEDFAAFERAVRAGEVVLPCTSAVRRVDVGGLPPRAPRAIDVASPEADLADDPRTRWLVDEARGWKKRGEKALVFVRERETLDVLAPLLESMTQTRVTLFHEDLSPAKRDIEVAAFRESSVPLLLCTEAGGEGRNFQFCDRMVHFDLPLDPTLLEQRIGRLDRIGREKPVEIVYFRHPEGAGLDLARLYERLDLFGRPASGLDAALAPVRPALEAAARAGAALDADALVREVEAARSGDAPDIGRVVYADAYRAEMGDDVLADVPADLEERTRRFCVGAAEDLGFDVVDKGGAAVTYIEFGSGAKVDSLPGVPGGVRYLGTFDRAEAVAREEIEFFASGHPLVEGLLLELEDGHRGRVALIELDTSSLDGAGLVGVFKQGAEWWIEIVGADGEPHPEWVERVVAALPEARGAKLEKWGIGDGWAEGVRALAKRLSMRGELVAAAFFRA